MKVRVSLACHTLPNRYFWSYQGLAQRLSITPCFLEKKAQALFYLQAHLWACSCNLISQCSLSCTPRHRRNQFLTIFPVHSLPSFSCTCLPAGVSLLEVPSLLPVTAYLSCTHFSRLSSHSISATKPSLIPYQNSALILILVLWFVFPVYYFHTGVICLTRLEVPWRSISCLTYPCFTPFPSIIPTLVHIWSADISNERMSANHFYGAYKGSNEWQSRSVCAVIQSHLHLKYLRFDSGVQQCAETKVG